MYQQQHIQITLFLLWLLQHLYKTEVMTSSRQIKWPLGASYKRLCKSLIFDGFIIYATITIPFIMDLYTCCLDTKVVGYQRFA